MKCDRNEEQTFQKASVALNLVLTSLLYCGVHQKGHFSTTLVGSSPVGSNGGELIRCGTDPLTKISWSQHHGLAVPSVIFSGCYGRGGVANENLSRNLGNGLPHMIMAF